MLRLTNVTCQWTDVNRERQFTSGGRGFGCVAPKISILENLIADEGCNFRIIQRDILRLPPALFLSLERVNGWFFEKRDQNATAMLDRY